MNPEPKYVIYEGPPKPPFMTKEEIEEIQAGLHAVAALRWGSQNPKAAEVEAQAIADFRAKRDAQRTSEAAENRQD